MASPLVLDRKAIAALCREYGVRRLVLFGSAVTGAFDAATSDVDFLVEFADSVPDRFDAYFGLKEGLETLLGRPVDLVDPAALKNPYLGLACHRPAKSSMQPDAPALLWQARSAASLIRDFVAGRSWEDYERDPMLRSAVERQFQVIGEALNRLGRSMSMSLLRYPTWRGSSPSETCSCTVTR